MSRITAELLEQFKADCKAINDSEMTVKEKLSHYSRLLLDLLHNDVDIQGNAICDIRLINELLEVLKTTNRKVAVLFFQHFTGFRYDSDLKKFVGKDKAHYIAKKKEAQEFLDDPHNNIWTWADRHIEVKPKEFTLSKVTAQVQTFIKKAQENNIPKADLIKAIMAGGITEDELVAVMEQFIVKE